MARMQGVEPEQAGWITRVMYWIVKRKVGQRAGKAMLPEPVKITAHHPRLLKAFAQMEMGQEAARTIPSALKEMVCIRTAMLVGCPY